MERIGKHALTEGVSGGYSERDALAFFERAVGEAIRRFDMCRIERRTVATKES